MKRLLLAIWLSWLVISLIGCAPTIKPGLHQTGMDQSRASTQGMWTFQSVDREYSIQVPNTIPNFSEWQAQIKPIHIGERFRLYAMGSNNPDPDKTDRVVILWASDGPAGDDAVISMIGICYIPDVREPNGKKLFYVDKSYWSGGKATGKLELVDQPEYLEDLIRIREDVNSKVMWKI